MRRPKPDRPATWAECIAGAVGVFALMTLAYAVIPHEWITFSDKYLQWDTTSLRVPEQPEDAVLPVELAVQHRQARRSATSSSSVIYVVFFGLNLALFAVWQKRGQEKPEAASRRQPRTSRFGRPLRRRAGRRRRR